MANRTEQDMSGRYYAMTLPSLYGIIYVTYYTRTYQSQTMETDGIPNHVKLWKALKVSYCRITYQKWTQRPAQMYKR